ADRDLSTYRERHTSPDDQHETKPDQECHQRAHQRVDTHEPEVALRVFPVETVERFHLSFFLRVRANHAHTGEVFLRARRNLREKVLNLFESSVNLLAKELYRQ